MREQRGGDLLPEKGRCMKGTKEDTEGRERYRGEEK